MDTSMRERQKAEAIKRMKKLCIHEQPIKEFIEEGKLNLSENGGALYWLNDKEQKMMNEFEKEHDSLVYHIIKNRMEFGVIYSLLYVSKYIDEWEMDMKDIEEGQALVYVMNINAPDCSEFGTIGIEPRFGGIIRTW